MIRTVEGSETLKARARAIRDELADVLMVALSEGAGLDPADPDARLAAALLLATWSVAYIQAPRTFEKHRTAVRRARPFSLSSTRAASA
ncbi:hypothetical protein [Mesorhizobium sp. WSM4306]|uniref:hypothetical protein n=1 Tax=unclassified Mesorhizobium TaxID=325217 RepID=UPI0032B2C299